MKHLKLFETENQYQSFKGTIDFILPNVSYVINTDTVYYSPYIEPSFIKAWYDNEGEDYIVINNMKNVNKIYVDGNEVVFEPAKEENFTVEMHTSGISVAGSEANCWIKDDSYYPPQDAYNIAIQINDDNYIVENGVSEDLQVYIWNKNFNEYLYSYSLSYALENGVVTKKDDTTFYISDEYTQYVGQGDKVGFFFAKPNGSYRYGNAVETILHYSKVTGGIPEQYRFNDNGVTHEVKIELKDNSVIDSNMFENCGGLINIEFPDTISNIGRSVFNSCVKLENVIFTSPKITCTDLSHMFANCLKLASIDLSSFDISAVESIYGIFWDVPSEGTLYYNPEYDYSQIIAELPEGWTATPIQ